jgi:hypothetical protein
MRESVNEVDDLISIDYLEKKSYKILRWATENDKELISEKELRKSLRDKKKSELEIDLMLNHLKHTDRLAAEEFIICNKKVVLMKIKQVN